MDNKLIIGVALSFSLVLAVFLGVLVGLYFFTLNVGNQFTEMIKNIPISYILSIGGVASVLSFIKNKYKK